MRAVAFREGSSCVGGGWFGFGACQKIAFSMLLFEHPNSWANWSILTLLTSSIHKYCYQTLPHQHFLASLHPGHPQIHHPQSIHVQNQPHKPIPAMRHGGWVSIVNSSGVLVKRLRAETTNCPLSMTWTYHISRWWFQLFLFLPLPGKMIQFDLYFSKGLKPPTRYSILIMMHS